MKKHKRRSNISKIPCINCITLARCKALAKKHKDDTSNEEYNFKANYIFFMNLLEYEVCSSLKHYINIDRKRDTYKGLLQRTDRIKAAYNYIIKGIT